jgi:hypothetical protein
MTGGPAKYVFVSLNDDLFVDKLDQVFFVAQLVCNIKKKPANHVFTAFPVLKHF